MSNKKCDYCDEYREKNHNFCRRCGNNVRKGFVNHVRVATAFSSNEKFCGYCGGEKYKCKCYEK